MSGVDWAGRLAELAADAGVPGAVLGIWADGEQTIAPYGVLSRATCVEVTADSVFQVGSITKTWNATMILQLADEGRLTLDSTVAGLLPGVRLTTGTAGEVTVRQLLTHTSGIDGDIFTDTGRGDDCLERYAGLLGDATQIFPPGAAYSYCNSGFVLLGRIIEVLDGRGWDASLRARLVEPLGLTATVTLPEEALLHRAAVGHNRSDGEPVATWMLPRSLGPAGLVTQSAADLLTFARMHLDGGVAADGTRVLSPAGVAAMQAEQVRLPAGSAELDAIGLAWRLHDWGGRRVFGHDGTTIGQLAFLRIDPEARLAVCLFTNSPNAPALYRAIVSEVLEAHVGIRVPPTAGPVTPTPAGVDRHQGRYERAGVRFEVEGRDDRLTATVSPTGDRVALADEPVTEYELEPADASGDHFVLREAPDQPWAPLRFDRLADGTPYLFCGGRVTPLAG